MALDMNPVAPPGRNQVVTGSNQFARRDLAALTSLSARVLNGERHHVRIAEAAGFLTLFSRVQWILGPPAPKHQVSKFLKEAEVLRLQCGARLTCVSLPDSIQLGVPVVFQILAIGGLQQNRHN
jgi:hypothetical protein